jgi:hypothetical protein
LIPWFVLFDARKNDEPSNGITSLISCAVTCAIAALPIVVTVCGDTDRAKLGFATATHHQLEFIPRKFAHLYLCKNG